LKGAKDNKFGFGHFSRVGYNLIRSNNRKDLQIRHGLWRLSYYQAAYVREKVISETAIV